MGKVIYIEKFNKNGGSTMLRQDIERLAKDILDSNGLNSTVIDPVRLASIYGIKVLNAKFAQNDISGLIKKDSDSITIYVNSLEPTVRKRFTVAHELGHYFLDHLKDNDHIIHRKNDVFSTNEKEIDANAFAAALLMDESKVKDLHYKLSYIGVPNDKIVSKLSDLFKVSRSAVNIRLRELSLLGE